MNRLESGQIGMKDEGAAEVRVTQPGSEVVAHAEILESGREQAKEIVAAEEKFMTGTREKARGLMARLGQNRKLLMAVAAAELLHLGSMAWLMNREHGSADNPHFSQETAEAALSPEAVDFLTRNHGTVSIDAVGMISGGESIPVTLKYAGDQEGLGQTKARRFTKKTLPLSVRAVFDSTASISKGSGAINDGYNRIPGPDGKFLFVRQMVVDGRETTEVLASPPSPYSYEPVSQEYSGDLDLTPVGGPRLEGLVRGETMVPFARVGPDSAYDIFTTAENGEAVASVFEKRRETVLSGIGEAEELFGFRPGQAVKRINIAPEGGFMNAKSAGTTVLLSENWLKPETSSLSKKVVVDDLTLKTVAKHETFHSIDARFGNQLSRNLIPVTRAFPPGLADKLNETAFIGISLGGHAKDNQLEFFASLANALTSPKWTESTAKLDSEEKKLVLASLNALENSLVQTDAMMEKWYTEQDTESSVSQPRPLPELTSSPIAGHIRRAIDELNRETGVGTVARK